MDKPISGAEAAAAAEEIVGTSPAFLDCLEQARRIAHFKVPVLIEGETGTGKEIMARQVHQHSDRSERPFVSINCAALPRELMESEFFGHRRGAFTHAVSDRGGYVEEAHSGTLFLDEISSLDLVLQAKLLRFLQEGEYRQVGGVRTKSADVRIVAASNEPLLQLAQRGQFRLDLYFRLDVFRLRLPPLHERTEDIPLLVDHFLRLYARRFQQSRPQLTPAALTRLRSVRWPGNVRQLQNLCLRLVIQHAGGRVGDEDLLLEETDGRDGGSPASEAPFQVQKAEVIRQFEVTYLRRLLDGAQGNVSRAARTAGKHRRALSELLRKHRIDPSEFRPGGQERPWSEPSGAELSDL